MEVSLSYHITYEIGYEIEWIYVVVIVGGREEVKRTKEQWYSDK